MTATSARRTGGSAGLIVRGPAAIATIFALVVLALGASGCGTILGSKSTPTQTFTPAPTQTPTPTPTDTATPTPTSTATPTATPTPALPDNPNALERWDTVPVTYCVVPSDEGYTSMDAFTADVDRAFSTWGVPFTDSGSCDAIVDEDGVNEIGWGAITVGQSLGGQLYEAGLTSLRYRRCTSGCDPNDPIYIIEADIRIDTTPPSEYRSDRCLYSTLLHEVGHFLGLEHLPPPAVMAAETSTCIEELTDADRDALLARYGPVAQPQ